MENNIAFGPTFRLGVLGGGQLGRMMIQAATDLDLRVEVMDPSADAPCRHMTHRFVQGDLKDADAVFAFGKDLDVITIEIEHVSAEGLHRLKEHGVRVMPDPEHLAIIQDKGLQKQFYADHHIPTADFQLIEATDSVGIMGFPIVQKLRTGGYDGKGVKLLHSDVDEAFKAPAVLEKTVDIDKELSVIVARNSTGEVATFPVVEAVFDPVANLVDFLLAPAAISDEQAAEAQALAIRVAEAMDFRGLLAVELFLERETGQILVNEVAPRTHNSGHHTIEANQTSQFEQHLRAILDLPLGDPSAVHPVGAMVNLVGGPDAHGTPVYQGLAKALATPGIHPHIYGKSAVKPFRKMGHVTLTGQSRPEIEERIAQLRDQVSVEGELPLNG